VTLRAAAKDYVEIAEGRMNAMLAMATGKFKIQGNMGLAMKLEKIFKR
jgi:putative sterol carrier protein